MRPIVAGSLLIFGVVSTGLVITWFAFDYGHAWAGVVAELVIACVIYYELEEERASRFLSEVLGKPYEDPEEIYHDILPRAATTLKKGLKTSARSFGTTAILDKNVTCSSHISAGSITCFDGRSCTATY